MAARTFKFYGKAFSQSGLVNVTAMFNEVQIYSGSVTTVNSYPPERVQDELVVLFEYIGTTEIVGNIPFELTVTNGVVFFGDISANYSGIIFEKDNSNPESPIIKIITPPEDIWRDVNQNSIETDGKNNVTVNNIEMIREVIDTNDIGDWYYKIPENGTLTCNIFVDPSLIFKYPD
jgi:hypothetical protein